MPRGKKPLTAAGTALAGTLLAGLLALTAQPALAAGTSLDAGTPAGAPATLLLHTIPAVKGVRLNLDGRISRTGRDGSVAITTVSGTHHISIMPPPPTPSRTVRFSRWLDGLALANRDITLSPGTNREQAGMVVSHPITVRFTGPNHRQVPASDITQVTVDSSLGESYTFPPSRPPRALPVNRIVRNQSGLAPLIIRYSVRDVIIDGSNVVYGGSQNFHVRRFGAWTVTVLLFPLRVEVKDALFGFGIGSAARLKLPNGSSRIIKLGPGHTAIVTELPRATYQLAARGPGFGLTSPTTLSKPQVAKLLLLSWIDILAVAAFAMLFAIGLPLLGGRIIRHPDGPHRLAWRADRAREKATRTPVTTAARSQPISDVTAADGEKAPSQAAIPKAIAAAATPGATAAAPGPRPELSNGHGHDGEPPDAPGREDRDPDATEVIPVITEDWRSAL